MKISSPKVSNCEVKRLDIAIDEGQFCDALYNENVDTKVIIPSATFDECILRIDFSKIELRNVDMLDVIFKNCDLSNKCFDKQFIEHVRFVDCKLVGTSFIDGNLRDIEFINCNVKYANFSDSKIKNIKISGSEFSEVTFNATDIRNAQFSDCKFCNSEFAKVHHDKLDFTDCDIMRINFDISSLKIQ